MSDSIKDQVTIDLQKAREEGKTRAERVQQIIKNAFAQTADEVKQGSSEIRLIAKDSLLSIVEKLDQNHVKTIDVKVEPTETEAVNVTNRELDFKSVFNSVKNRLVSYLQQEYATLSRQSNNLKERLDPLQARVNERYGDRFTEIRQRVAAFDTKLTERYGDRYVTAKQRLDNFQRWYQSTLTQAETVGPGLLQQKQIAFEEEVVAQAGASVAQKEQQIKQQVKQFLQSTVAKL